VARVRFRAGLRPIPRRSRRAPFRRSSPSFEHSADRAPRPTQKRRSSGEWSPPHSRTRDESYHPRSRLNDGRRKENHAQNNRLDRPDRRPCIVNRAGLRANWIWRHPRLPINVEFRPVVEPTLPKSSLLPGATTSSRPQRRAARRSAAVMRVGGWPRTSPDSSAPSPLTLEGTSRRGSAHSDGVRPPHSTPLGRPLVEIAAATGDRAAQRV
jgi:hypothetical protein